MVDRPPSIQLAASTVALGVGLLVAAVAGILLALNLVNVLVTVFLAITLAETIRPAVVALERRRVPRSLAILAIYLLLAAVLAGSLALVVPPFMVQVGALVQETPHYVDTLRDLLPGLNEAIHDLGLNGQIQNALGQLAGQATPILRSVVALPVQVVGGIITVLSGFVLAAFWIGLTEDLDRALISRLPVQRRVFIRSLASDLSATLGGWLRGELILMVFVGALSFLGLVLLGVRYPVALAVWAGVTEILPIVGPWIGGVPAVLIAGVEGLGRGGLVFLLYLGIQQVENNFLVPKVMQRAVGLHPFVVLVALLVGGTLLGIPGIIISVPAAATLQVLVTRLWLSRLVGAHGGPHGASIEEALARVPTEKEP